MEDFGRRQTKSTEDEVEATDGANKGVRRRHVGLAGPKSRTSRQDGAASWLFGSILRLVISASLSDFA